MRFLKVETGRGRSKVKESVKVVEEIGRVHRPSPVGKVSDWCGRADPLTYIYTGLVPLRQYARHTALDISRWLASLLCIL